MFYGYDYEIKYIILNIGAVRWVFLPRDAMSKSGLCYRPVSVRLSACHVGGLYPHG